MRIQGATLLLVLVHACTEPTPPPPTTHPVAPVAAAVRCPPALAPSDVSQVETATRAAYDERTPNLDYVATFAVSATDWARIMRAATPSGYGAFQPDDVGAWLGTESDLLVCAAREGSVAVYVMGPHPTLERVMAEAPAHGVDEASFAGPMLRLWWD